MSVFIKHRLFKVKLVLFNFAKISAGNCNLHVPTYILVLALKFLYLTYKNSTNDGGRMVTAPMVLIGIVPNPDK